MERQVGRRFLDGKRPPKQQMLPFPQAGGGEAPAGRWAGATPPEASPGSERATTEECLMEEVCESHNLEDALKRVRSTGGFVAACGATSGGSGEMAARATVLFAVGASTIAMQRLPHGDPMAHGA